MKKKIPKGVIATIIIFAISGLAFVSGYLRESIVTEIEELKVDISNDENDIEQVNLKISEILNFDSSRFRSAFDKKQEGFTLNEELEIRDTNLTSFEREVLLNEISNKIYLYREYIWDSNLYKMFWHWKSTADPKDTDFYFARENVHGFELSFTEQEYDSFDAAFGLIDYMPNTVFLNDWNMSAYIIANTQIPSWIPKPPRDEVWSNFLRLNLLQIQNEIESKVSHLAYLESKASFSNYGVTLITVTTILATAMAAQLNEKEREVDFSHIKAEIYDDKSMIIKKKINYAIPLLIAALIFAILGLILPIIIF
ncbi:MAG: hypothetical protein ACTSO7_04610 [Candidatus Heimdallarchaeota archaeon]